MNYDQRNLAVEHCASNDKTRYALNGIRFEAGRTIATDGRVLAIIDSPKSESEPSGSDAFTVGRQNIKDIRRTLKGHKTIPGAGIAEPNCNKVKFSNVDPEVPEVEVQMVEGNYPNWEMVVPTAQSTEHYQISIGTDVLMAIAKTAKAAGANCLRFRFPENQRKPFLCHFDVDGDSDRSGRVVGMPMMG